MTRGVSVANSSPLIVYQRIGNFELLQRLLGSVLIPPAVRQEVFGDETFPEWIQEQRLSDATAARIVSGRLGAGEREAIALAVEIKATRLIIDDLPARRLAQSLGIQVIGSLGLALEAKDQGLIPTVRPLLESMQKQEFRISSAVLEGILKAANET